MKKILFIIALLMTGMSFAQSTGDVMFTEIGNGGTKKALYHGGDYVELTILKDGTCLGGCYLTDYSSSTSAAGERQTGTCAVPQYASVDLFETFSKRNNYPYLFRIKRHVLWREKSF